MKNFKLIMLVAFVALGCNMANALSVAELQAQKYVAKYLTDAGFTVEIDKDDDSVNFNQSGVNYWITFKNGENGILYTLHRRPIKMRSASDDDETALRLTEKATYAANDVNRKRPYKVTVKDARVDFTFPVYASTPEEYTKMLLSIITPMYSCKEDFDKAFEHNKVTVDSIHNYWSYKDPNAIILPQQKTKVVHKEKPGLKASKTNFASLSAPEKGEVLINYDTPLTQGKCKYLTEKFTVTSDTPGTYTIGFKLYNPDGKLIVPAKNAQFTTITEVEIKKAGKETEVTLTPFGTDNTSFWVPGVYLYELYDGDAKMLEDVFSISNL